MSQGILYVQDGCPACKNVKALMSNAGNDLKAAYRVATISFENNPDKITSVPTLMMQSGATLSGSEVYEYLKAWRKDASTPHTRHQAKFETFNNATNGNGKACLIVGALLIISYVVYRKYNQ